LKIKIVIAVVFASLSAVLSARAQEPCAEPVKTGSGLVRGEAESGSATCVWRGVPYAAPPVGELRWKAPQPVSWSGVREAVEFGDRCMQGNGMMGGGGAPDAGMSEDCLYLNIWRPQGSGPFPVMFWVHGGGYYTGSGGDPQYWGDRLAQAGQVMVVTINYRLALFGFMAHPALREEDPNRSTGGYGTLDQAAALKWVRENIGGFGGDPDNITIFGQSAGGASICSLVATPRAKGLFRRAIIQSGLCELSRGLDDGYAQARGFMKEFGCAEDDIACMRRVPAATINKKAAGSLLTGFIYMPCHDGYVLTDTPLKMIEAGNYNHADLMAGTVLDEFGKAVKIKPSYRHTPPGQYERRLVKSFGFTDAQAKRLAELYPLAEFGGRPVEAMGRMLGADAVMQCPTYRGLTAAAPAGQRAWLYRFDYHGMKYGKYLGSYHTAELPFLFDSFDRAGVQGFYKGRDLTAERELTRIMQAYWTNFARTGDPNGAGLPVWPAFTIANEQLQVLDTAGVKGAPAGIEARCGFWKDYPTDFVPFANRLIQSLF
jgi:para-nitrobenzyl esterase